MANATYGVDETPLHATVKVRFPWSLDARRKLCSRQWEPSKADAGTDADGYSRFLAQIGPCVNTERQKTNVVVKTVGEAEALLQSADSFYAESRGAVSRVWQTGAHARAYKRLRDELIDALEDAGHSVECGERSATAGKTYEVSA